MDSSFSDENVFENVNKQNLRKAFDRRNCEHCFTISFPFHLIRTCHICKIHCDILSSSTIEIAFKLRVSLDNAIGTVALLAQEVKQYVENEGK